MPATANPVDRRSSHRRQPAVGTICRLVFGDDERSGLGLVWNISNGGVSLLTTEPIEPGSAVQGQLETLNGQCILQIHFHVAHLTKLQTGDYCVGGRFDHAIDDAIIKPFLGS
jgi:hypothetical protein